MLELVFLLLGVRNSYVCRLGLLRLRVNFLTFTGYDFFTFGG